MKTKKQQCAPIDLALKSLFLGPQSENSAWFGQKVNDVLNHTFQWRLSRFPQDGSAISADDQANPEFQVMREQVTKSLESLLDALEKEKPKFTPRYVGHMVSEISLPSLLGEFAMLLHNPNNASREASSVGLKIEAEAIGALASMIGFDPANARGHFTSGGTIANFEGVWRAINRFDLQCAASLSQIDIGRANARDFFNLCHSRPQEQSPPNDIYSFLKCGAWSIDYQRILGSEFRGPVLLVPNHKHYSWAKAASIFGLGLGNLWSIDLDSAGRLDIHDLKVKVAKARKECRPILAIVSVAGTTELGEVDPVGEVQDFIDELKAENIHLWHHVDAAFGGFLCSIEGSYKSFSDRTMKSLESISRADTVTLDPHKLGYVPYACGAFLARDANAYSTQKTDAPYLSGDKESIGWATTLEGSRSAAGAAAVWLTSRSLPFNGEGFGRILKKTIDAKVDFQETLASIEGVKTITPSDTNVLCFAVVSSKVNTIERLNAFTQRLYTRIEEGTEFSVSRTRLLRSSYGKMIERLCAEWRVSDDRVSDLFVIRLVLMNPFIASKEMTTNFSREFASLIENFLSESE